MAEDVFICCGTSPPEIGLVMNPILNGPSAGQLINRGPSEDVADP